MPATRAAAGRATASPAARRRPTRPRHPRAGLRGGVGSVGIPPSSAAAVLPTDVLIKFTRYGDANLDGIVNLRLQPPRRQLRPDRAGSGRRATSTTTARVNLQDFNRLAANFGLSAGADAWSTPARLGRARARRAGAGALGVLRQPDALTSCARRATDDMKALVSPLASSRNLLNEVREDASGGQACFPFEYALTRTPSRASTARKPPAAGSSPRARRCTRPGSSCTRAASRPSRPRRST